MCVYKFSRFKFWNYIVNESYDWKFIAEIFNIIRNSNKMNESWEQSHVSGEKKGLFSYWESPISSDSFLVGQK